MKKRKVKTVVLSKAVLLRQSREIAMPEVKRLVKFYGRTTIGWCVNQLATYDAKLKRLKFAKEEVADMEKDLVN